MEVPFKGTAVGVKFMRASRRCENDGVHFHDLCHESCSRLFEAGYQIHEVALVSDPRDWAYAKVLYSIESSRFAPGLGHLGYSPTRGSEGLLGFVD